MPTITTDEVEARLRATATACEPLVESLLDHDPTEPVVIDMPRRRLTPWLAAAAVLVVVALGAALLVARDDAPDEQVAAGADDTVPAPPGTGLLLPDGSRVEVTIPGPDTWAPAGASVGVDLAGLPDPRDVRLRPGTLDDLVAEGVSVQQDLGGGRAVVVEEAVTMVAVAHDGWVATMDVATTYGGDEDLPPEAIDGLARGLDFSVTPEGPVDVVGPGVRVRGASRALVRAGEDGDDSRFVLVQRAGGRPIDNCESPVPMWACSADDTILVQAPFPTDDTGMEAAEELAAGIEIGAVTGEVVPDPLAAQTIVLPNLSEVDVDLPADRGWEVTDLQATATLDDEVDLVVDLHAREGEPDRVLTVVDAGGRAGVTGLLDGWEVSVLLVGEAGERVPRDRWDALAASLRLVDTDEEDGFRLLADGLEVLDAAAVLRPTDGTEGFLTIWVMREPAPVCTPGESRRCLYDDQVVAEGRGPAGRQDVWELVVGGLGRTTPGG